ncbi:MAG: phospholipid-binding protein MlaC [Vibrio sp.]
MSWFKKITVFTATLCMAFTAFSASAANTDPYQMMQTAGDATFARLKAEQPKIKQDPNTLKTIVDEELMPYVNYQYAALKLLGPNLKGADKAEVKAFITEFRAYLISSYAQVLTQYTDQTIKYAPAKKIDDKQRIVSIPVEIVDSPRPNIKLEFTLLKDKKTGEWKAYDMVAEGISLISSKQSEWNTKIRQDGIPAVTKELKAVADKDIVFEGKK